MNTDISKMELYAWVGEDELGNPGPKLGLKQAACPAGIIPMVSVSQSKLDKFWNQAEEQAAFYGKKIYLVKLSVVEIVNQTKGGK